MGKRKIKIGADVVADGNLPLDYAPWSGDTADTATVQTNLDRFECTAGKGGLPSTGTILAGGGSRQSQVMNWPWLLIKRPNRYRLGWKPARKRTGLYCNIRMPTSCDNRWRLAIGIAL